MRIPLDRSRDRRGRLPLARQIQLHLERLITQRLLAPGVKLPATRDLARDLASLVATHPVRDDVHALRRMQLVFVVGPDLPWVRSRTPFEFSHSIRPRRV